MGTYANALFSHSGDAQELEALCRWLVEVGSFTPGRGYGHPDYSAAGIEAGWGRVGHSFLLDGDHGVLALYPRVARLHHGNMR